MLNQAVKSLRRRRTRTLLTVAGIVIGVAMILVLLSIASGTSTQTNGLLRNALGAEITVTNSTTPSFPDIGGNGTAFTSFSLGSGGTGFNPGGFAAIFGAGTTLNESLVSKIGSISGVYATSPELSTTGYVNGNTVLVDGIDPSTYSSVTNGLDITSGTMLSNSTTNGILLPGALATSLGVTVGSTVTVGANSTGGNSYTVVGLYSSSTGFGPASRTVYVALSNAQTISGETNLVSDIYVKTVSPGLVSTVAALISSTISGVTAQTSTSTDVASSLSGTLSTLFVVMGLVALVAGGFGVVNTMMMSISERTREVGTLRAIGAEKIDIIKIFLSEAFVMGLIGALVGVAIGIAVSLVLPSLTGSTVASAATRFASFGAPGGSFSSLRTSLTVSNVLLSLGLGLVVGTLAGIYPAWRASKMDPVEALRHV